MINERIGLIGMLFLLVNCGHVMTKSESYASGAGVEINGAQVRSVVKPNGGQAGFSFSAMVYTAGSVSLDGPFLWRIEAEGKEGIHKSMTVHRLKVATTTTKRSEWFPSSYLGKAVPFERKRKEEGLSFAKFQLPGELEVYPKKDGDISILAEISIASAERTERKVVRFALTPESSSGTETLNIPGEIVNSMQGKDPTEWEMRNMGAFFEDDRW